METCVFEIELTDGRIWRVFCSNSNQKQRFIHTIESTKQLTKKVKVITNGLHSISQWEKQIKDIP